MDGGNTANQRSSPIFDDISDERIAHLCAQGQELRFEANHRLFERGDDARQLMILREGVVELLCPVEIMGVTRDVTMEAKQAGDVVAWSAIVSPYRFTLSARCSCNCTLTALHRDTLNTFFESDPKTGYFFMRNLAGVIGRRLNAMQTMWMHDLQASAVRRLE